MNKEYTFYDSSRRVPQGPFFTKWVELIGEGPYFSREDIELLAKNLGRTHRQRILGLRKGNSYKIAYLHSAGNLMIIRLTEEQSRIIEEKESLQRNLTFLRKELYEKNKELISTINRMTKEVSELKVELG